MKNRMPWIFDKTVTLSGALKNNIMLDIKDDE
jgi:hypothetical protein